MNKNVLKQAIAPTVLSLAAFAGAFSCASSAQAGDFGVGLNIGKVGIGVGIHSDCCCASRQPVPYRVAPPAPQTVVVEQPAPLPPPPPRQVVVVHEPAPCPPPPRQVVVVHEPAPCPVCEPQRVVHVQPRYYATRPVYPYQEQCAECQTCEPAYSSTYNDGCAGTYSAPTYSTPTYTTEPATESQPTYTSPVPSTYQSTGTQTYDDSEPVVRSQSYSGTTYGNSTRTYRNSATAKYYSPVTSARSAYGYQY